MSKRLNGVHVPHAKNTSDSVPTRMPAPDKVMISMAQHIGAPCTPTVKIGDLVKVGQVIGEGAGFVSAPVHASVSGKVTGLDDLLMPNGSFAKAVTITADHEQAVDESVVPPVVESFEQFTAAVRKSGLVGLGGAGFPTSVKLSPKDLSLVDTVIVNGAECEPYITSDNRTLLDSGEDVMEGIRLVKKYLNIGKVIIGIEDNKPQAIENMKKLSGGLEGVEVMSLPAAYPQGAEKVLIYHTAGRVVPEGKLPMDVGVIVINCTTIAFIAKYLRTGMPLVEKCVTVDGSAVRNPQNVIAPIGTPVGAIFEYCGGYKTEPKKILLGDPMMGIAVPNDSFPLLKNNNAVLAFDAKDAAEKVETPCIRCGRCASVCPFFLQPAAIEKAYKTENVATLEALKVNLCMECGCCAFACPAKRELVLTNKLAKKMLREKK